MPLPSQVAAGTLELIGNSPVVELACISDPSSAQIFGKLESFNPGGSVKDRICLAMIESAEQDGRLLPGGTIVEPTSGNTGIGLAMVAAARGYRLILTMPDTMSEERRSLLGAYGAELVLMPDENGMTAAIDEAHRIAERNPGFFMPAQFSNPANPEAHRRTTAREILEQCPRIDAFVAGVGTGGTITGVGSVLKAQRPHARIVAVEPSASAVLSGGTPGLHRIQGIGAGFVPANLDRRLIDEIIAVDDDDAEAMTRRLASEEGILVGISSGAAAIAAVRVAATLPADAIVLCMLCDSGERYLTTKLFERGGL
ncbi:MAG TPA: cysteine synthase A [Candidatus Limnocylindrales bacterium]|nr:cysteine synthase A [Candidatus Limnocylindrales bacterium]